MSHWTDEYMQMVEDCEFRSDRMNDWEVKFVDSVKNQIEQKGNISSKQIEKLNDIWEKITKKG